MTNRFSVSGMALAALLMTLAGTVTGYLIGHDQGVDAERGKNHAAQVQELGGMVESFRALVGQSNAASKAMREALNAHKKQDANTTRELKDALAKTADKRVDCRFDDDVMRQLSEARGRAAARAAGGIRTTVPGADRGEK